MKKMPEKSQWCVQRITPTNEWEKTQEKSWDLPRNQRGTATKKSYGNCRRTPKSNEERCQRRDQLPEAEIQEINEERRQRRAQLPENEIQEINACWEAPEKSPVAWRRTPIINWNGAREKPSCLKKISTIYWGTAPEKISLTWW
jgi:hypothetical protein